MTKNAAKYFILLVNLVLSNLNILLMIIFSPNKKGHILEFVFFSCLFLYLVFGSVRMMKDFQNDKLSTRRFLFIAGFMMLLGIFIALTYVVSGFLVGANSAIYFFLVGSWLLVALANLLFLVFLAVSKKVSLC